MKSLFAVLILLLGTKNSNGQIGFGSAPSPTTTTTTTTTTSKPDVDDTVNTRGLLAPTLCKTPLGQDIPNCKTNGGQNSPQSSPSIEAPGRSGSHCCCSPEQFGFCPNPRDYDGGFLDAINPRLKVDNDTAVRGAVNEGDIGLRIVNNPPNEPIQRACPSGFRQCCYQFQDELELFGSDCQLTNQQINQQQQFWKQGCQETFRNTVQKQCGQRSFQPLQNLEKGQASPDEFPWNCLMLTDQNRFIGACAIVPDNRNNDVSRGTSRVITAAHKLSSLKGSEGLKVRIIEYDASGFNQQTENSRHEEFLVRRFIKHPKFDSKRLSDDIAVLILDRPIDLLRNKGVNAACYPQCNNMFDYQFNNGTGVRCWVAGYGKDDESGDFSFIQRKVDVPVFSNRNLCNNKLKSELAKTSPRTAANFQLTAGEICAGGEQGKDSCDGDGGAPLVCMSQSRRWHVVGLVAWGVGCGRKGVPGVYVNVFHYLNFITNPSFSNRNTNRGQK